MWGTIRSTHLSASETNVLEIPDELWWTLGYLLFIWISLSLIEIWSVTPDMLMASLVFLTAGLIAQIRAGSEGWHSFVLLGLVLGLGYLSKTFMFSMAVVFLGITIVVARKGHSLSTVFLATGVFLLLSLPFILLISEKSGKFTIGEAGTVTYLRYVNDMPFPHWQGDPLSGVVPAHPSRIVHHSPPVYEFGEPIGGTYPISTDPSFWYEGIKPRFDPGRLLAQLFASGFVYAELFFLRQGIFVACVIALYTMGQTRKHIGSESLRSWALVIPAVFAFGLYATVLVEDRYVGAFILLFWADILANIQLPNIANNGLWLRALGAVACIGLIANIVIFNLDGLNRLKQPVEDKSMQPLSVPARPLAVAQTLRELGVNAGDKVAVIGYAYDSYWARLARVKIVSEMLETDAVHFWRSNPTLQQTVLQAFAGTGAKAVIAEYVPQYAQLPGWQRVGISNYYIYVLTEP
jgi:4-amino-4-deoxy-L-arabinose transferase-like glycosyltransferase